MSSLSKSNGEKEDRIMEWVLAYIDGVEIYHGKMLTVNQRKSLALMCIDFVEKAVDKYVKGAIEHKGELHDKKFGWLQAAMNEEIIDLWHYNNAQGDR